MLGARFPGGVRAAAAAVSHRRRGGRWDYWSCGVRRGMNKTNIVRAYFVDGDFPVYCKKGTLFGVGIYAKLVLTTTRIGQFEESFVGSHERFWGVHKLVNWN